MLMQRILFINLFGGIIFITFYPFLRDGILTLIENSVIVYFSVNKSIIPGGGSRIRKSKKSRKNHTLRKSKKSRRRR